MERAKKGRERERIDKPHSHIHCTQLFTLGFFFISFDSYKSPIIFPRPFLLSFATVVGLAMRGGGERERGHSLMGVGSLCSQHHPCV